MRLPAALLAAALAVPAFARELHVGEGREYPLPSAAARAAQDGDTVLVDPGEYYDCAVWRASRLTIAATGPGAVVTDSACGGKAAFVITGTDVLVQGLTFQRVRVPDGNGAGIRQEGRDLTVRDSRFVNNQDGILAGGRGGSLRIEACAFEANGPSMDGRPTHGVLAGALDLLRIERTVFASARGGDHIASTARRTEIVATRLVDPGGSPMTGALVAIGAGALLLDGSTLELAAAAAPRPGAVLLAGRAEAATVTANTLVAAAAGTPMVRNWSGATVTESGNTVPPGAQAVSDSGSTYRRLRAGLAELRTEAAGALSGIRHGAHETARAMRLLP
jgi:hypothetical protein